MPDCAACPLVEQVRQHRAKAETSVVLLQKDLAEAREREAPEDVLVGIGMALSRSCLKRDYCDRLLAGMLEVK